MIISEVLIILSLLVCLAITVLKLLNIMNLGDDDLKNPAILFILFLFSWAIGFISLMSNPSELVLINLFSIETFLFYLTSILFGIESILFIKGSINGRSKYKPD